MLYHWRKPVVTLVSWAYDRKKEPNRTHSPEPIRSPLGVRVAEDPGQCHTRKETEDEQKPHDNPAK